MDIEANELDGETNSFSSFDTLQTDLPDSIDKSRSNATHEERIPFLSSKEVHEKIRNVNQQIFSAVSMTLQYPQQKINASAGTGAIPPSDWQEKADKFTLDFIQTNFTDFLSNLATTLESGNNKDFATAINSWLKNNQEYYKTFNTELYKIIPYDAPQKEKDAEIAKNTKLFTDAMNNASNTVNYMSQNLPVPLTWTDDYPLLTMDGVTMVALPGGYIWPKGGFKEGTSESYGYTMLNAIQRGDQDLYMHLFKGYCSFCGISKDHLNPHDKKDVFGLMGWGIAYENGKITLNPQSATDADQDIILSMIQALRKWPDLAKQNFSMYGSSYTLEQIITNTIAKLI